MPTTTLAQDRAKYAAGYTMRNRLDQQQFKV